jgi:hypothetical protein
VVAAVERRSCITVAGVTSGKLPDDVTTDCGRGGVLAFKVLLLYWALLSP